MIQLGSMICSLVIGRIKIVWTPTHPPPTQISTHPHYQGLNCFFLFCSFQCSFLRIFAAFGAFYFLPFFFLMYVETAQQCSFATQQIFVCLCFIGFYDSLNTKEHIRKYKAKCFYKILIPVSVNWQSA